MTECARCRRSYEEEDEGTGPGGGDGLEPLVEVGTLAFNTTEKERLCPSCRDDAKLLGAAALFGIGEFGD